MAHLTLYSTFIPGMFIASHNHPSRHQREGTVLSPFQGTREQDTKHLNKLPIFVYAKDLYSVCLTQQAGNTLVALRPVTPIVSTQESEG